MVTPPGGYTAIPLPVTGTFVGARVIPDYRVAILKSLRSV